MKSQAMMHAMRLGTLQDVADPLRRAHVPVLEIAVEGDEIADEGSSNRIETQNDDGHEKLFGDLHGHFQWMKNDRTRNVHAAGAMVHLVKRAPQEIHAVGSPVVSVDDALEDDEAQQ